MLTDMNRWLANWPSPGKRWAVKSGSTGTMPVTGSIRP
jgi:hypothetical protein